MAKKDFQEKPDMHVIESQYIKRVGGSNTDRILDEGRGPIVNGGIGSAEGKESISIERRKANRERIPHTAQKRGAANSIRLSDAPEKEISFLKRMAAIGATVLAIVSGWGVKKQLESGPDINKDGVVKLYDQKRLSTAVMNGDEDIFYRVKPGDSIWSIGKTLLSDEEDVRKFVKDVQAARPADNQDPSKIMPEDQVPLPEDVEEKVEPIIEELETKK